LIFDSQILDFLRVPLLTYIEKKKRKDTTIEGTNDSKIEEKKYKIKNKQNNKGTN